MANVIIYSKQECPYCVHAKTLLHAKNIEYIEYKVDEDLARLKEMLALSNGRRTVPQIFINDQHIGGFDDLKALQESGELDAILNN